MIKIYLLVFSAFFLSCTRAPQLIQLTGKTMGTSYSVKIFSETKVDEKKLHAEIEDVLKEVNRQMSTYIDGSEIDTLNKKYELQKMAGGVIGHEISPWFAEVLKFSLDLAEKTNGVFDPTLGPLVNLWGFGPDGVRKVPEASEIEKTKTFVGYNKVQLVLKDGIDSSEAASLNLNSNSNSNSDSDTIPNSKSNSNSNRDRSWIVTKTDPRVYIDLSATAKGFGVDKVSDHLLAKGLRNHLVDIGGELKAMGTKSPKNSEKPDPEIFWRVAIEYPEQEQHGVVLTLPLQNKSIATSGSYRNFFAESGKNYSHTINHKTGRPIEHNLISVTIVSPSCMVADGLATALHALGPEAGWDYALKNNIAAYFITVVPKAASEKPSAQSNENLSKSNKLSESSDMANEPLVVEKRSTPAFEKLLKQAI